MRNIMPSKSPETTRSIRARLIELGGRVRTRRKSLGLSAVAVAEAAGLSRVTLYRIEHGEPSVTLGAYLNVMAALDLDLQAVEPGQPSAAGAVAARPGWIPARIRLDDYPQLQQLAWPVTGTRELTPAEALGIYERNWRHVEAAALEPREQELIDALRLAFGDTR